jgi:hypothetical protein
VLNDRGEKERAARKAAEPPRTAEQIAAEEAASRDRLMRYACRTLVERAVLDRKSLEILNRDGWAIRWNKAGDQATVTAEYAARNALGGMQAARGTCAIAYSDGKATPLSFTPTR